MKYPFFLLFALALIGCQESTKVVQKKEKEIYQAALYFRYVADVQEVTVEFAPTKQDATGKPQPVRFSEGVFYNGGAMEEKKAYGKIPPKYMIKTKDQFPVNIELKIKDQLDFITQTPILKSFSARKEGNQVTIDTKTPLSEQDQIVLVFFDSDGKDYTQKLVGNAQLPYTVTLPAQLLSDPIAVSAIYQKRFTQKSNNLSLNVLLEYYSADIVL